MSHQVRVICKAIFFTDSSCTHRVHTIAVNTSWCEIFTDNFDVVPDREALYEMRGTAQTQDLRTDGSEILGKQTFIPTNFLSAG